MHQLTKDRKDQNSIFFLFHYCLRIRYSVDKQNKITNAANNFYNVFINRIYDYLFNQCIFWMIYFLRNSKCLVAIRSFWFWYFLYRLRKKKKLYSCKCFFFLCVLEFDKHIFNFRRTNSINDHSMIQM